MSIFYEKMPTLAKKDATRVFLSKADFHSLYHMQSLVAFIFLPQATLRSKVTLDNG